MLPVPLAGMPDPPLEETENCALAEAASDRQVRMLSAFMRFVWNAADD